MSGPLHPPATFSPTKSSPIPRDHAAGGGGAKGCLNQDRGKDCYVVIGSGDTLIGSRNSVPTKHVS
jgi:hypothetical protein